eukprot:8858687-Lingulodinium_polyedra.AAC.1
MPETPTVSFLWRNAGMRSRARPGDNFQVCLALNVHIVAVQDEQKDGRCVSEAQPRAPGWRDSDAE